ncbi:hypothetical protein BJ742DRAFT_736432 [Cladochytrium replicatum]|nr:hypothetical protein BJ742DRAFT_736432 [Cladochytrium replicatum]
MALRTMEGENMEMANRTTAENIDTSTNENIGENMVKSIEEKKRRSTVPPLLRPLPLVKTTQKLSQASQNSKTSHFQLPKPITYIWPLFSKRRVSPSFTPIRIVVVGGSHAGLQVALRLHKYLVDFPGMSIILIEKRSHFQNNLANPLAMVDMDVASKSWISYEHAFTGNNGARFVQDTVTRLTRTEVTTSRSGSFEYDYLVVATGCTPVTPIRIESLEKPDGLSEMQTYFNTILGAKRILVVGGGAVGCEIAGYIKSRYPSKEVTLVHSHQDLIPLQYKTKFKESVLRALQDLGVNCILNDLINTEVFEGKTFSVKTCTLRTVRGGIRVESDLQILATGTGRPCSDFMLSLCDGDRKSLKNGLVDHSGRIIVKTTLQLAWGSGNIFALGDVAKTGGSQNGISLMTQVTVVVENLKQLMEEKISGAPPKLTRYNPDVSNGTIAIWIGDEGICCIANTLVLGTWATRIIKDKHALIDTYTKALRAT